MTKKNDKPNKSLNYYFYYISGCVVWIAAGLVVVGFVRDSVGIILMAFLLLVIGIIGLCAITKCYKEKRSQDISERYFFLRNGWFCLFCIGLILSGAGFGGGSGGLFSIGLLITVIGGIGAIVSDKKDYCTRCGAKNYLYDTTCIHCGKKLRRDG